MRDGIIPVMEMNGNRDGNGNGMFGDNGAWWIIIIILLFGYGRNGFGNGFGGGSGGGSGAYDNYVLASDFSQLSRQISDGFSGVERRTDNIINGICDLGYNQLNLSNGINQNVSNGFYNTLNAITTNGYETRLGQNAISQNISNCCCDLKSQIAQCCCDNLRALDGINYNMATNTCSITTALNNGVRDIVDNQNANYRALHDEIIANRLQDKEQQIQAQQNEINALRLKASQEAQNAYLLNELKPCPKASYIVQPPQQVTFPTNCCNQFSGFNNGCGCGNY